MFKKKMRKIREVLTAFAASVGEAQKKAFIDSLNLHYQNLSRSVDDAEAPDYNALLDEIIEMVAPSEITTFRYAPEQTVAKPLNDDERDACAAFCEAAKRYCGKVLGPLCFSETFRDAFHSAIIAHYLSLGASGFGFELESGRFPYLPRFLQRVRTELSAIQRQREKETPDAFEFDVVSPSALETPFSPNALRETLAFLESLKSARKFDPTLIALFGSAWDGLRYLNPKKDGALQRALERERNKIKELLNKRFPVDSE